MELISNRSFRTFWVIFEPLAGIPGKWSAHCLDTDVVSQGTSLSHAFRMIVEAVEMILEEDGSFVRKAAPPE